MSTRHTVTLHHDLTVYNDMFDHMDGVMRSLAKKKTRKGRLVLPRKVSSTEAVQILH